MKIGNSSIRLSGQHSLIERELVRESIRVWVGNRGPDPEGRRSRRPAMRNAVTDVIALSNKAQSSESPRGKACDDDESDSPLTAELRMLKLIIEKLFGREIKLVSAKDPQHEGENTEKPKPGHAAEPGQGFGIEYDYRHSHYESEETSFSAKGVINTADGRKIAFTLNLKLSRELIREQNINVRAGDAARLKDPLIVNFNGNSAELTDTKFSFDIDSDGKAERVSLAGANSGFLAIDRNKDNIINDGSELFGPETGNGFMELTQHDSDHNNWIDESDPIYNELRIWSGNDDLLSLREKGAGAIYLGYQTTQFELNSTQGQLRASGIYVSENGSIGTIQQVDLVT